jgi:hypothetical protein
LTSEYIYFFRKKKVITIFNKMNLQSLSRCAARRVIEAAPIAIATVGTKRHNAHADATRAITWIAVATDGVERRADNENFHYKTRTKTNTRREFSF